MKLTVNLDAIVARVQARRAVEASLRARGVAVLRDWRKRMTGPVNQSRLLWNAPKAAPRQAAPGELLFEFHVERTHTFYRVELRDHGKWGVEAQFLDPVDVRIARTFRQDMDPTRSPREMAIAWAEQERKAIEDMRD